MMEGIKVYCYGEFIRPGNSPILSRISFFAPQLTDQFDQYADAVMRVPTHHFIYTFGCVETRKPAFILFMETDLGESIACLGTGQLS